MYINETHLTELVGLVEHEMWMRAVANRAIQGAAVGAITRTSRDRFQALLRQSQSDLYNFVKERVIKGEILLTLGSILSHSSRETAYLIHS